MKITNFRLVELIGGRPTTWKFKATVDVKTFWGKKVTLDIYKPYAGYWIYSNTGKFCSNGVDEAERVFTAKQGMELQECDLS